MRKTWLALLLLLAGALPMAASAGLDTSSDSFGVYFDTAGNVNHLPGGMAMYANTEVYIILMNPLTPIKGFELAYHTTPLGAAQFRSAQVIEGGSYVDLGTSSNPLVGDYRCGYAAPRPIVPAMVMVHWTYGNYSADPGVQFFLSGVLTNPSRPGGLPVLDGGPGVGLRVAGISSCDVNLPCARTGGGEAPVIGCGPPVPSLTIDITAGSNGLQDPPIRAATTTTATDGYDGGVDIPKPTPPPGNYVIASFEHPDWSLGPRFGADVRAKFNPAAEYRVWPLMVETDQAGDVGLSFTPNFTADDGIMFYLKDLQTDLYHNLFPALSYVFTNNGLPNRYRFELIVGAGLVPPALTPASRELQTGWSMVGLPVTPPTGATVGGLLIDPAPGYAYAYDYARNTGYRNLAPATVAALGTGYWLATDAPFTWTMTGTRHLDGVNVPLTNGWNLVGNANWFPCPFEGLRVIHYGTEYDWLTAAQMGLVSTDVQSYDSASGAYVDAVNLQPWHGYWINALTDGLSLRFYWGNFVQLPKRLTMNKSALIPDDDSWQSDLTLVDAAGQRRTITLGMNTGATRGFDATHDKPQPPQSPAGGPLLVFNRPEWELAAGNAFSRDLVGLEDESVSWSVVLSSPNPGRAALTWDPKEWPAGVDFQLYLPHENRVAIMSMRRQTTYTVKLGAMATQVVVRTPNFTSGVEAPPALDYAVAVSPNPFNPQTTVAFDLPAAGNAEVRVYSVRGELVAVLGGGSYAAGRHQEEWRGVDRQGRDVPSGSYFARLYVDGQARGAVTKMSLVR